MKLIGCNYNNSTTSHFKIEKMQKLVTFKYYKEMFYHNIKKYIKKYNICLVLKALKYNLYNNF